MPNLKEVRLRIASVQSTQQITSAMKMVAASKLRKGQNAILQLRPYANKLQEILQNLTASLEGSGESIYASRREVMHVLIVVMASNRGLCGAFNSNVIRATMRHIQTTYSSLAETSGISMITIGRKASEYFRKNHFQVMESYDGIFDSLTFDAASPIAESIMKRFASGEFDRVDVIYNQFKSAAVQRLITEQFLPVLPPAGDPKSKMHSDYLFEPDKHRIVSDLIPRSLKIQFFKDLLDSYASEMGARMTAMHQATDNASELLKDLKLSYNKARQAAITKELLEIVTGAEALKG
ncbi:MAG: ATP synthase F1 subunit gamma [Bacteroidales bacterium]|nr:ATP synthase F1 subunit gamma [Lentimicrobiaceae bacterium]MDD5695305.1 ATP synthase F1 subunit gamma [Bacteroidales bacterium]